MTEDSLRFRFALWPGTVVEVPPLTVPTLSHFADGLLAFSEPYTWPVALPMELYLRELGDLDLDDEEQIGDFSARYGPIARPGLAEIIPVSAGAGSWAPCHHVSVSPFAFRPLGRLRRQLDLVASGEYEPEKPARKPSNDEVSIMASKVSLLGERLRGAQFEVSDLRGNIDRLLQDLEDAVLIFNRERRLVFASGLVARFLGRERAGLSGESIADIFPPSTNLGFLIAQASETGMVIRNRLIPLESAAAGAEPAGVLLSVDLLEAQSGGRGRACWCVCAIRRRSARSAANCRRPTGWRPSAGFPAAWRTR